MNWCSALALVLGLGLQSASAQTSSFADRIAFSGSAAIQSDYRYRGQTLSDGKAAPQLSLNLDDVSGAYLGGYASRAIIADRDGTQLTAYAGYAQRQADGWSWEAGCMQTVYTLWHVADYGECYAGAAATSVNVRLYYAPHYLGRDARTLYGEFNYFLALHPHLNLVAHGGLLHTLSGAPWPGIPAGSRYDARLGLSLPLASWTFQLARVLSQADDVHYLHYQPPSPHAWVLSAAYAF